MTEGKGLPVRCWLEYLGAIVFGNIIYFLGLLPHLPPAFRHKTFQIDLGLAVDFAVCVAVYGAYRLVRGK